MFLSEMHFVYRKYAILGRKTVYCRYELFTGKPAYHMNTFYVDWSPTVDLGHNKIDGDKLKDMQERADRAISRKRKCEDEEFEAQMMEQELMEQECHIDDEAQNDKACHIRKLKQSTRGIYHLTFLTKRILPMTIIKYVITLDYQIEKCY